MPITRYPLLFTLKYIFTKRAIQHEAVSSLDEIIGAYRMSGFVGNEGDTDFIGLVTANASYEAAGQGAPDNLRGVSTREPEGFVSDLLSPIS